MLSLNNISVQFNGIFLFKDVSFVVGSKDRIGLAGKNGAGKTTLLRIIRGEIQPETGSVSAPSDCRIAYLPQEMNFTGKLSIFDEVYQGIPDIYTLETQINNLTDIVSQRTDYSSEEYLTLINQLNTAIEKFNLLGGNTIKAEIERVLIGLGFRQEQFSRSSTELSGGWQMRIELAKILLSKPQILLLDEPTNHLDIMSIEWLEDYLNKFEGAVIVVSHDRAFLDNVTNRTIEINLGKIYDYKASYSEFEEIRAQRIESQKAAQSNQAKEIAATMKFVERFRYKATKARQVQSKLKMLEKIERIEIDELDHSSIVFRFPQAPKAGKIAVTAENLSKKYGNTLVFSNIDFVINSGEKVAFVGVNGAGKTTLSKIIACGLEHEGKLEIGYNISIGYYAQNQDELLNPNKTVFETIDELATDENRTRIRAILGSFLFDEDDITKKVKVLSGGEKSRLALACLLLKPVNLLVLDEPTNHLDMASKDILKRALLMYDGTLILVSHDRDFLQGITNRVFEFKDGRIYQYHGEIYDFLENRKIKELNELIKNQQQKAKENKDSLAVSEGKKSYEEKKNFEREVRKIENRLKTIENEITALEEDLKISDQEITIPENHINPEISQRMFEKNKSLREAIQEKMEIWEKLNEELEMLKKTINL